MHHDATYIPPPNGNFAAALKPPPTKKADPTYMTLAPVYNSKIVTNIYDCAMAV